MGKYVAEQTVKHLIKAGTSVKGSRVLILGITFKENVKDFRNTKVVDIYNELKEYGVKPYIFDPLVIPEEINHEYGIDLISDLKKYKPYNAIILAVKHNKFLEYNLTFLRTIASDMSVLIDVKSVYDKKEAIEVGFNYWRL